MRAVEVGVTRMSVMIAVGGQVAAHRLSMHITVVELSCGDVEPLCLGARRRRQRGGRTLLVAWVLMLGLSTILVRRLALHLTPLGGLSAPGVARRLGRIAA